MANQMSVTVELFFEAGRKIRKKIDKEDGNIPFAQTEVLKFVCDRENPTMRDLARHLEIRAPSATALVNQLARGGYVRRESDTKDRRQVRLLATKKARRALDIIMKRRKMVLHKLLLSLSAKDHTDMQRILKKMINSN